MKKELKDYLGLYIGGKIQHKWSESIRGLALVNAGNVSVDDWWLILRPIISITDTEMKELAKICYKRVFNHLPVINKLEVLKQADGNDAAGMIFWDQDGDRVSLTVDIYTGVSFYHEGTEITASQFECIRYLLKQGFDLFGLIEAGLAIERKEDSQHEQ